MRDQQQHVNVNLPLFERLSSRHTAQSNLSGVPTFLNTHLHLLLNSLDGVPQNPHYHPEGDALYHSLQVFQLAHHSSSDPALWAAALLHDIGKAVSDKDHAIIGAEKLEGLLSPRIVWLVRHHLHLLTAPRRTRRWLRNTLQLRELEQLHAWDLRGRSPYASVMSPKEALNVLMQHSFHLLPRNQVACYYCESQELVEEGGGSSNWCSHTGESL
jgi:hypothetical protein